MSGLDDIFPARTTSEEETRLLGRSLAGRLIPGAIVALYGDLGAGKTALTKGICEGLGVAAADVNSPTFTILHEYTAGSLPIYHFDAYRIERAAELFDLGYQDYFFGGGVTIVEWADRVEELVPPEALRVRLHHVESDVRWIELGDAP